MAYYTQCQEAVQIESTNKDKVTTAIFLLRWANEDFIIGQSIVKTLSQGANENTWLCMVSLLSSHAVLIFLALGRINLKLIMLDLVALYN